MILSTLTIGLGYSLRPWKPELAQVRTAVDRFPQELVLVQSELYPFAGYDPHVKLLAPHSLEDAGRTGGIVVPAPNASAYPFTRYEWACLAGGHRVSHMPDGLLAIRLDAASRVCSQR